MPGDREDPCTSMQSSQANQGQERSCGQRVIKSGQVEKENIPHPPGERERKDLKKGTLQGSWRTTDIRVPSSLKEFPCFYFHFSVSPIKVLSLSVPQNNLLNSHFSCLFILYPRNIKEHIS
jgi:hypothetical protein